MQRLKLIALVLVPLIMVVLFFQNRQLAEVNLIFFKVPVSVTVLLLADLLVGFGIAARGNELRDEAGWQWLLATLAPLNRHGRLNRLSLDGERLFGYRDIHGWKGLCLRKLRFRDQLERSFEDSAMAVTISVGGDNHGCAIATRPQSETGWHDLAPDSLLVVLVGGTLHFSQVAEISED